MKPLHCKVCQGPLKGRQRIYCSERCRNKFNDPKYRNAELQRDRGIAKRLKLLMAFGCKCEVCGYDKNHACLTFHHKDPKTKKFPLHQGCCSNRSWASLLAEAAKCQLLCCRCHTELHFPDCAMTSF